MDPASASRPKPKLHRSHTALPKITASFDGPSSKRHHHHHLPRHHHKHHQHGHSARETIQSAIQLHPPTSFGDLLKQSSRGTTPQPESQRDSRRESGADLDIGTSNELREVMTAGTGSIAGAAALLDGLVRPEDVERERARAKKRQEEIRTTLSSLLQTSLRSTRRLDDTYYSILEHVAALRASIASLQELSGLTRALHDGFRGDADDLAAETAAQIDAFEGFEQPARRVQALEERIRRSKEKARGLDERLEEARRRVLERERIEGEKRETARRRARIFWIALGVASVVLALLLVASHFRDEVVVGEDASPLVRPILPRNQSRNLESAPVPLDVKSILSSAQTTKSKRKSAPTSRSTSSADSLDDPLLRIFDEL